LKIIIGLEEKDIFQNKYFLQSMTLLYEKNTSRKLWHILQRSKCFENRRFHEEKKNTLQTRTFILMRSTDFTDKDNSWGGRWGPGMEDMSWGRRPSYGGRGWGGGNSLSPQVYIVRLAARPLWPPPPPDQSAAMAPPPASPPPQASPWRFPAPNILGLWGGGGGFLRQEQSTGRERERGGGGLCLSIPLLGLRRGNPRVVSVPPPSAHPSLPPPNTLHHRRRWTPSGRVCRSLFLSRHAQDLPNAPPSRTAYPTKTG
jgi:hypothetical protein